MRTARITSIGVVKLYETWWTRILSSYGDVKRSDQHKCYTRERKHQLHLAIHLPEQVSMDRLTPPNSSLRFTHPEQKT